MTTRVEITVDELAPGLNGTGGLIRMHFHAYRRLRDRWLYLVLEALGRRRPAVARSTVTIVRRYASRPLDVDNAYASAKIPLDVLRRAGVIPDDDPESVVGLSVRQVKVATRGEESTTIVVEAAPATPPADTPDGSERRPALCRNRLRAEGRPYPRSGCASCGDGGLRGCPYGGGADGTAGER